MAYKRPKQKKINFIALCSDGDFYGKGETLEAAAEDIREKYRDYCGDEIEDKSITMYEVSRSGSIKITVEWVSE